MAETRVQRWTRDFQYGIDNPNCDRFVDTWDSQDSDRQDADAPGWNA